MEIAVIALGLIVITLLWAVYRQSRSLDKADARVESAKVRIESAMEEADRLKGTMSELRAMVKNCEAKRREEADAYLKRSSRYEDRISELIRQIQNMSERIASLRKEGLPEGGNDFHVEEPEEVEPWAQELQEFYDGIESVEAQEMVEHYIVEARERGIADEQILRNLGG